MESCFWVARNTICPHLKIGRTNTQPLSICISKCERWWNCHLVCRRRKICGVGKTHVHFRRTLTTNTRQRLSVAQQVSPSGFEISDVGAPTLGRACPAMGHRWHPCLALFFGTRCSVCTDCQIILRETFTSAATKSTRVINCRTWLSSSQLDTFRYSGHVFAHVRNHSFRFSKSFSLYFGISFNHEGYPGFRYHKHMRCSTGTRFSFV